MIPHFHKPYEACVEDCPEPHLTQEEAAKKWGDPLQRLDRDWESQEQQGRPRQRYSKELLSTPEGQFYTTLSQHFFEDEEDPAPVTVLLKSGKEITGYVYGLTGSLMFQLSERKHEYFPEWEIAFSEVAAIYREGFAESDMKEPF